MPFLKSRSGGELRKPCAFLTGKERDTESANDYFGARYYFAGNARWLSVDPEKVPTDPQRLNGYLYVRNDPVNFVDRDGRNLGRIDEGGGECSADDPFCGSLGGWTSSTSGIEGDPRGTYTWYSHFRGNPGTTSPPPGGGTTAKPKDRQLLPAAKSWALKALQKPECAALFPQLQDYTPAQALEDLSKGGELGKIQFRDLTLSNGTADFALTGPNFDDKGKVLILFHNGTKEGSLYWNNRDRLLNTTRLLEELGHAMWYLNGRQGGSFHQEDVGNPDAEKANEELISTHCLPDRQ